MCIVSCSIHQHFLNLIFKIIILFILKVCGALECLNQVTCPIDNSNSRPVCGDDGRTYSSHCLLQLARCNGHRVTLAKWGKCGGINIDNKLYWAATLQAQLCFLPKYCIFNNPEGYINSIDKLLFISIIYCNFEIILRLFYLNIALSYFLSFCLLNHSKMQNRFHCKLTTW